MLRTVSDADILSVSINTQEHTTRIKPLQLLRTLRKLGFNVTGNTGFAQYVFASWVCTDKTQTDSVYVRPMAGESWEERRLVVKASGGFEVLHSEDDALSIEMVTALSALGYTCYSNRYRERGIFDRGADRLVIKSADFYVKATKQPSE